MAADFGQTRLGGAALASRVGRLWLDPKAARHFCQRDGGGRCPQGLSFGPGDGRACAGGVWHTGPKRALVTRLAQRRELLVPRLQRAGIGLRPGIFAMPGPPRGQRVGDQWLQNLDHPRPPRHAHVLPGAHRQQRQAAARHQLLDVRAEQPGHTDQTDHQHLGRS